MQHKGKSCAVTVGKHCEDDVCCDNHVPLKLFPASHKSNLQTNLSMCGFLNWCFKSLYTVLGFFWGGGLSKVSFSIFSRFSFIVCRHMVIKKITARYL